MQSTLRTDREEADKAFFKKASVEFRKKADKLFLEKNPKSNFVLCTNSEAVKNAYYKLIHPFSKLIISSKIK